MEHAFRDRVIKALVATPTLAAGINLPARRVIVRDTTRYDARLGVQAPIPALEIQQMLGRAGRPRFDTRGEAPDRGPHRTTRSGCSTPTSPRPRNRS